MRNHVFDPVGVACDGEIETPGAVHPCLPEIRGLVIFLSLKRWVQQVVFDETELFVRRALNGRQCILQCLNGTVR